MDHELKSTHDYQYSKQIESRARLIRASLKQPVLSAGHDVATLFLIIN